MDKIAVLPMIGAIFLLTQQNDARKLFIYYFLPIFMFIPSYYETKLISGIPELSFWSSAFIPIFAWWVLVEKMDGYKFSYLDLIIFGTLLSFFWAQFQATGYKDAQKILFVDALKRFLPYLMMKGIFMSPARRLELLRVSITLSAIITFFMLFEWKLYTNHLDTHLRNVWPGNVPWGGTMARYGFKRAAGPFAHPICAGYFYAIQVPLAFWYWRNNFPFFKGWALSNKPLFAKIVFGLCVIGVITAGSRAPMMGLGITMALIGFGWTKKRALVGSILLAGFLAGLVVVVPKFVEYVSIKRSEAKNEDQENAAYRKEMLDNYIEVVAQRYWFGWGRFTFPVVNGQASIDNEYLFIALTAGMMTLYLYLLTMIWVIIRLLLFALKRPPEDLEAQLAWCLLAAWIGGIFTQATVYAGTQTLTFFYFKAAMTEAIIISGVSVRSLFEETITVVRTPGVGYGYQFSRTL
ncbi:MAG: O-antigen ligase family protein [Calditrichia bacterium]